MKWNLKLLIIMTAVFLIGAACGSDTQTASSADGGGGPAVSITEPEDGADVQTPFTLTFASSEDLGPAASGKHHVHVFFEGNEEEYTVVETTTFEVTDLPPGEHIVGASLRHADHSPAGAEAEITVNVAGGGGGSGSEGDGDGTDPYNYGY